MKASSSGPIIIFLAGYGRSGSTLLCSLLASVPGAFALGELSALWGRILGDNKLCACGEPFGACPLWTEVVHAAYGAQAEDVAREMLRHKAVIDRLRFSPVRRLRGSARSSIKAYAAATRILHDAVQQVTGCHTVVDATKVSSYLQVLPELQDRQTAVVHLIRDARAVAFSQLRPKPRPEAPETDQRTRVHHPARTAAAWLLANANTLAMLRRRENVVQVRYEDLVVQPEMELRRIHEGGGLAKPDLDFLASEIPGPGVQHMFSGNSVRLSTNPLALRPDLAWTREMSARHRRIVTTMTWPLLRRFGYPLLVSGT